MALLGEFLINLAAGLAYDLLKAGAARLKAQALGEPAQRALQRGYETAFRAMLEEVATDLTPDDRRRLEDILRRFVARPEVTEGLLALALTGAPLPDLPALERAFARQFDRAGLEVGPGARFDRAMRALHRGLTTALLEEAGRPDSPLFNRVNLGRLLALQALLQDPGRALAEVNRRLARLEARGGQTVYNIVIAQATGVAIGDGATVQGSLPPDVQDVLDAMLALLRELRSEAGGRSIAIGGGVGGSILITGDNNIVQGITHLPTNYDARIRRFINEYTGTPEEPVPFGGREAALAELDRWLADADAPPYLLLAAPAGRGKSALLVRWLERVRERNPDLPPVFVPVSLRLETASQAVFFAALAARLAHLYGEKVPADLSHAPDFWRGMVSSFLGQPPPQGRLLVVLDGLDEATDWRAGPDLFPFQPPPGVRVVVSARYLADEEGPSGWLRRLGWDRPGLARPLDLDPLTREGVADVLERMGFPLAELGRRVDIVAELHRLSEGDPLLVRLYVDDLWQRGEAATRLQPEDLRGLKPGLEGYFDRWWADQRKQWGARAPLKEPAVREVLNLLAAALAPLMQADLLRLSPDLDTWTLEEALRPLARLVIGDGREQGYAFGHPRLGQYFWEKLGRQERRALEERFLTWGWETLEALKRREMAPADAPAYLVRALGGHLVRAKAGPEEWLRLVDGAWAAAGEALEGAYGLFLQDVHRAWQACAAADGERAERGERAPYLGGEVR
ncbi:MAG TPA: hypothetical protein ENK56_06040, partial [Chloroflexi bacterium]|nr:hypothetical protein [Chloroflexota bacterium]